jgi:hypothetical protein
MVSKVALSNHAGDRPRHRLRRAASLAAPLALAVSCGSVEIAEALPSFARQTGQTCSTCHTAYLQLTPFGRLFKLNGYISGGGGPYGASGTQDALFDPPLPIAFLWQAGYTNYNRGLDAPTGNYSVPSPNGGFPGQNNYVDLAQQASVFYGGKIYGNLGMFAQLTYGNDRARVFGLDNLDIRYTGQFTANNIDVLWGITANNNPTVQDVWNTVPAWQAPFLDTPFAFGPAAATMLDSLAAPSLAVGTGAYVFINNTYYAEMAAYGSLTPTMQTKLGSPSPPDPAFTIDGLAPYYRLAFAPVWGEHAFEIGTYGMFANILPDRTFGVGTNKISDVAFDSQYQWLTDEHAVTLRANYIFERQILDATTLINGGGNGANYLRSLRLSGEYVYNHMYSFTSTYWQLTGSPDAILYANNINYSPNSAGWTFDVAYLPFMRGGPKIWPWFNTRLGVAYTIFNQLDGGATNIDPINCPNCRNAKDNNTLFVYAWTMW